MASIIEEKINRNKSTEFFECIVLKKEEQNIVLYYKSDSEAEIGNIIIPDNCALL